MKRGPLFEKQVVEYLRANGHPEAERRVMGGVNDRGDVAGIRGWTLEVKNTACADLGVAMSEADKEAKNAGTLRFAVVKRRRNKPVADAYAVVPLWLLAELMREGE